MGGSFATTFVTIVHVLLCVFMIFVILLQPGKDAGMGAAFGGGAATSAFGGRGAVTFLSKLTAACATLFFVTSLGLSFAGLHRSVAQGGPPPPGAVADGGTASAGPVDPDTPGSTATTTGGPGAVNTPTPPPSGSADKKVKEKGLAPDPVPPPPVDDLPTQ